MKRAIFFITTLLAGALLSTSCDLDNYDGPDATIYGGIYDSQTGELIPQDIIQGSVIEYTEDGYENPQLQSMRFKVDGTYMNRLMFSNSYHICPVRGNFQPVDTLHVTVKGETKVDFQAIPYIRIKNVSINRSGNSVVATFNLEQTTGNNIKKIGLYAHRQPEVGEFFREAVVEQTLNSTVSSSTQFRLELDLATAGSALKSGSQYYFRVGALIDVAESKSNYCPAVRMAI